MEIKNVDFLFDNNPNPMWVYNPKSFRIVEINEAATRLYGYDRDELLQMTIKDLRSEPDIPRMIKEVNRGIEGFNDSGTWKHRTKKGKVKFVRIFSHSIKLEQKIYNLVIAHDITQQKIVEQDYHKEQELFNIIIEKLPGAFFLFNRDQIMYRWNKQLEILTGYSEKDVQEMPIMDYFDVEEQKKIQKAIEKAFMDSNVEVESVVTRKDGSLLPILFNASKVMYNKEECIVGIGVDITHFKDLLREKELLLAEVHHRVKNNLALVSSLLQLQEFEIKDNEFTEYLTESRLRIKTIALIHELLYKSQNFASIDFGKHLEEFTEMSNSFYNVQEGLKVTLAVDSVMLNINQAVPASLLVNEIFSKIHKSKKRDSIKKNVHLSLKEDNASVYLDINYNGQTNLIFNSENGKFNSILIDVLKTQLGANITANGIGMMLTKMLSKQLDAELKAEKNDKTEIHIQFKKRALKGSASTII